MAVVIYKSLKILIGFCALVLVVVTVTIWWKSWESESNIISRGTYTEHRDVFREHIVRDVEIDRRSIVLAARELLQGRQPEEPPARHVICPSFSGGLGNMLFQWASVYGISRRLGMEVLVKADSEMFQLFDIWAKVSTEKTVCSKAKHVRERKVGVYDNSFLYLRTNTDYVAKSYLQSWKYFEQYKMEVRKQLRFRGDIEKKAYDVLSGALTAKYGVGNYLKRTIVGVHVRRGNLLNKHERKYGYLVANKAYMKKALAFFRYKYEDVTFVVCSNDMKWSKANVTGNDVIYIEGNAREVDLAILSNLNHTILTVGTFGWWAGWLANGTTLFYKDFIKNGSEFDTHFQPDRYDYFYPGWIGL